MSLKKKPPVPSLPRAYSGLVGGISELLEIARRASARTVNALMTATYWEVGRRIVEFEQGGGPRAGYGKELLKRLAADLTRRFGRGFPPIIWKTCACSMPHAASRRFPRHCLGNPD